MSQPVFDPMPRPVVLGSTSRYRAQLLSRLKLQFEVAAPEVDETAQPGEPPQGLARRLALAKAWSVAALGTERASPKPARSPRSAGSAAGQQMTA